MPPKFPAHPLATEATLKTVAREFKALCAPVLVATRDLGCQQALTLFVLRSWPFAVGFGVTGYLIFNIALTVTGALEPQLCVASNVCVQTFFRAKYTRTETPHLADEDVKNSSGPLPY